MKGLVPLALAALVLSGCANEHVAPAAPRTAVTAAVNPNTAELVAARERAGLPDCTPATTAATPVAGGLPDLTVPCLGSTRAVNLADLRGRPMIVNAWATWCPPCKAEAPLLAAFHAQHPDVRMIGYNMSDPDTAAAVSFAAASGWTYEQVVDPAASLGKLRSLNGLPSTFFVDAEGRVAYLKTGGFTSAAELEQLAATYLGVTS